jgi:fermentation-respiration switch protein FrsA (DUF1100 family)
MATRRLRRTALGVLALLMVLVLGGTGLWMVQRRLIYFPDRSAPDLGLLGPGWGQVAYDTADGLTLQAWYRAPDPGQPVVIVFNGNAGNRGGRVSFGGDLADAGLGVLLTDYRGYGGNPGHPTEAGLGRDARAAAKFVRDRAAGNPVVYFGESLGAAVAVELATHEPPAALVLRSPFTSLADVGRVHYPWLPVSALLKDRYPSIERIGSIQTPTLVIAGEVDSIVPVDLSRDLYAAAPGLKRLLVVPNADHNDWALVAGREMIETVVAFIAESAAS